MNLSGNVAAVAAGIISHVAYFNRGEHHLYGPTYILVFLSALATSVITLYQGGTPIRTAVDQVAVVAISYLIGLFTSLITYRSFFHPLNKFPGPVGARISKFWISAHIKNSTAFRTVQKLHEEYGDFVRVGPSDLSIVHPNATQAIYGSGSKCSKAMWYDLTLPQLSLQTIRDRPFHDQRRRLWSVAFSDKAVRGYEERILKYRQKLISQIDAFDGQPVNVSKWFNLYTYDSMGDLAFGTSFNMLEASEHHWAIKLLIEGLVPHTWLFPTWFLRVAQAIPGAMSDWFNALSFCHRMVEDRMKTKAVIPDVMSTLLEPLQGRSPTKQELNLLHGDSQLVIIAGSDTTATTLTCILLELARQPDQLQKLREELAPYMQDPTKDVSHQDIGKLDHLNGIIYEALRLHPPVPTAIERKTPPEGIEIGGQHIPGNMTVWCSQYVTGRS